MEMTAAKILQLNGNMRDSPLMEVVRRFHALSSSRELPYCVVGGMAVIRNGYARTTMDVDILTFKTDWRKLLPLEGEISSAGPESCVDKKTGVTIVVCECVVAEVFPALRGDQQEVVEFMLDWQIHFVPLSQESVLLAGKHFSAYLKRSGTQKRVLPDFLIGAHAKVHADRLVAREGRRGLP